MPILHSRYDSGNFFDEVLAADGAAVRPHYRRRAAVDLAFLRRGVAFTVYHDHAGTARSRLRAWLDAPLPSPPSDTIAFLTALNSAVRTPLSYTRRAEPGLQTPAAPSAGSRGRTRSARLASCRKSISRQRADTLSTSAATPRRRGNVTGASGYFVGRPSCKRRSVRRLTTASARQTPYAKPKLTTARYPLDRRAAP